MWLQIPPLPLATIHPPFFAIRSFPLHLNFIALNISSISSSVSHSRWCFSCRVSRPPHLSLSMVFPVQQWLTHSEKQNFPVNLRWLILYIHRSSAFPLHLLHLLLLLLFPHLISPSPATFTFLLRLRPIQTDRDKQRRTAAPNAIHFMCYWESFSSSNSTLSKSCREVRSKILGGYKAVKTTVFFFFYHDK